jgi:hypothetical protein
VRSIACVSYSAVLIFFLSVTLQTCNSFKTYFVCSTIRQSLLKLEAVEAKYQRVVEIREELQKIVEDEKQADVSFVVFGDTWLMKAST